MAAGGKVRLEPRRLARWCDLEFHIHAVVRYPLVSKPVMRRSANRFAEEHRALPIGRAGHQVVDDVPLAVEVDRRQFGMPRLRVDHQEVVVPERGAVPGRGVLRKTAAYEDLPAQLEVKRELASSGIWSPLPFPVAN